MIINFYRLYGTIFYTIDDHKKDAVYFSNTLDLLEISGRPLLFLKTVI